MTRLSRHCLLSFLFRSYQWQHPQSQYHPRLMPCFLIRASFLHVLNKYSFCHNCRLLGHLVKNLSMSTRSSIRFIHLPRCTSRLSISLTFSKDDCPCQSSSAETSCARNDRLPRCWRRGPQLLLLLLRMETGDTWCYNYRCEYKK